MAMRGGAGAGKKARALQLIAGDRPQMRKASARSWTKRKEAVFLTVLTETCNVTRACAAADVGVTSAYRRRKENAKFRNAWLTAIAVAYQQLELTLLERAFHGSEKVVTPRAGEPVVMREYSNQLGLALMKMHRESAVDAAFDVSQGEIEEVRGRLIGKLRRLKRLSENADAAAE